MDIIPVIDLLDGKVVHAKRGDRKHYLPIQSTLCESSDPINIVHALIELYPFKRLYIADLNGIQNNGNHLDIITAMHKLFPDIELWLDSGFGNVADINQWHNLNLKFVIGTESLKTIDSYIAIVNQYKQHTILSLDFTPKGYKGPNELLENSAQWSENVITMTLDHVGSNIGPNHEKLAEIRNLSNQHNIYAAGGVRNIEDLLQLESRGIHGALVASAIHSGNLSAEQIMAAFKNN